VVNMMSPVQRGINRPLDQVRRAITFVGMSRGRKGFAGHGKPQEGKIKINERKVEEAPERKNRPIVSSRGARRRVDSNR